MIFLPCAIAGKVALIVVPGSEGYYSEINVRDFCIQKNYIKCYRSNDLNCDRTIFNS